MPVKIAATKEEASCLIASLVAETRPPCPCDEKTGLRIEGMTPTGKPVEIEIDAEAGLLTVIGVPPDEIAEIRNRRCPLRLHRQTAQET